MQLRGSPNDQREGATHTPAATGSQEKREVRWKEDVVDNEHMNKKKSKVCCIFHPQQNFEDMDDECDHCGHSDSLSSSSSSSSSSESESEKDLDRESRHNARKERRKRKLAQKRSTSPNAYEIQPDYSQNKDKQTNNQ